MIDSKIQNSSTFKYFVVFFTKSFLISVIGLLSIIFIFLFVHFIDLVTLSDTKDKTKFNSFLIVSNSMVPIFEKNDAIIVKRNSNDEYDIGDIISFVSNDFAIKDSIITHRIIKKNVKESNSIVYTTKGDNNNVSDRNNVFNDMIYGKVIFKIPKVGYLKSMFLKPSNFIYAIVIPCLLLIMLNVHRFVTFINKKEK